MHILFTTSIKKFDRQGEKTGWTYISIPEKLAQKLKPGNKKSFRVKGFIDEFAIAALALLPMGDGSFILALNAALRKGIKKRVGDTVTLKLEMDNEPLALNQALMDCLRDDPKAHEYFNHLTPGHQFYFSKWIDAAKSEHTRIRRLTHTINCLAKEMDYSKTLRSFKDAICSCCFWMITLLHQ